MENLIFLIIEAFTPIKFPILSPKIGRQYIFYSSKEILGLRPRSEFTGFAV
jgi:hypothetical protein